MNYILHKHPIQLETLDIVQYLHHQQINLLPTAIIERNHPPHITDLPSIQTTTHNYIGLDRVVYWYEQQSGINNILDKANEFKKQNPKYTCKK